MGLLDFFGKSRRIPTIPLGILCLGAGLLQLWLALGSSENLPIDSREVEVVIQETRSVFQSSQDLLKQIQEAGNDRQATQRLVEQMKQENAKWKRQQEERQARLTAISRRQRLGSAALAALFMLIAAKFLFEGWRGYGRTPRQSTAPGEGQAT